MNVFKKIFGEIYHKCLYLVCMVVKFREPHILSNNAELVNVLKNENKHNILLLSGKRVKETETYIKLDQQLKLNFNVFNYSEIPTDPDLESIEKARNFALEKQIDVVVAIGGGSTMDAGKVLAARLANPKRLIPKMKGLLHVGKRPLLMVVVPTTAGTGSECTVAAVVSDLKNNQKYAISDPKLVPHYALLDPSVLYTMPKSLTASTGMDALTHAIEAYIGKSNTKKTKKAGSGATKLIFDNLSKSYQNPFDEESRSNMQKASYLAGLAITKAYVGYVHAISHAMAAYYHLPHGLLNAVILPVVLESYGKSVYKRLGKLSKITFSLPESTSNEEAVKFFILKVKELLNDLNIENALKDVLQETDYLSLIKHINKEVYPLYPVPRYFSDDELIKIFNKIKNNA